MKKITVSQEVCTCLFDHYIACELYVIKEGVKYEGYITDDDHAIIPFGEWVEVYNPEEFYYIGTIGLPIKEICK